MTGSILLEELRSITASDIARIDALNEQSAALQNSDPESMLNTATETHRMAINAGYRAGAAAALRHIGAAHWIQLDFLAAVRPLNDAFEGLFDMAAAVSTPSIVSVAQEVFQDLGHFPESLRFLAARIEQEQRDVDRARLLCLVGIAHCSITDYATAIDYLDRALDIWRRLNDPIRIARTQGAIGDMYFCLGNDVIAIERQLSSLALWREHHAIECETVRLNALGFIHRKLKNGKLALEYLAPALNNFKKLALRPGQAAVLVNIGLAHMALQQNDQAQDALIRAARLADALDIAEIRTCAHYALGLYCQKENRLDHAAEEFGIALAEARKNKLLELEGCICQALQQTFETKQDYREALKYREYGNDADETAQVHSKRLALLKMQTRLDIQHAEQEREIYRLKNIELSAALSEVEDLNNHLLYVNKEKNEMLGIVAHDLKNPLAGITISVSSIKRYYDRMSSDQILEQLNSIAYTTERMSQTVENLLDANAPESVVLRPEQTVADVTALCAEIVSDYLPRAASKAISLQYSRPKDPVRIRSDKNALRQILENLISNAIKFSPRDKAVYVRIAQLESAIRLEVIDQGPGISKEEQKLLYLKFARLSAKPTAGEHSTGLGLSIVKKLVDLLGGTIRCESERDAGAAFYVELPLKTA